MPSLSEAEEPGKKGFSGWGEMKSVVQDVQDGRFPLPAMYSISPSLVSTWVNSTFLLVHTPNKKLCSQHPASVNPAFIHSFQCRCAFLALRYVWGWDYSCLHEAFSLVREHMTK